jgi:hypothetical protein
MSTSNTSAIRFLHHYVTNGVLKCKVMYSLDNRADSRRCVTIYSDSYGRDLSRILSAHVTVENASDLMTDYFEKDHVTIFEGSPFYPALRARAEDVNAKNQIRYRELRLKRTARRVAKWVALFPTKANGIIERECRLMEISPEVLAPYIAALQTSK